jgi:hypothetical protein
MAALVVMLMQVQVPALVLVCLRLLPTAMVELEERVGSLLSLFLPIQ